MFEELYNLIKEWDLGELNIAAEGNIESYVNDEEVTEQVLRMAYNGRVPVCMLKVNQSHLAICMDWFSEYVGDIIGKICDC